jgi:L-asparaginase
LGDKLKKIFVIALGGTIGSVKNGTIGLDSNNLKILEHISVSVVEFDTASPFSVLSENMSIELWQKLIDFLSTVDFEKYAGTIILHGSDTLAFTSAIIANAFPNQKIVLVASDKPIEDKSSNGIKNFNLAVDYILSNVTNGVAVAYDEIFKGDCITSANVNDKFVAIKSTLKPVNSQKLANKNILIINPYVGIDCTCYNLENVDCVLITMFHSATVPKEIVEFSKNCKVPVYFVTHKHTAEYETANEIGNIIFDCTIENAYARMLLTN